MSNMVDVHNTDREFELNNKKFQNSSKVSDHNKEAVSKFVNKCFAEGLSKSRARKYVTNFHTILKMASSDFKLLDSNKEDLEKLVAKIEQSSEHAAATKNDFKVALKKFYKLMEGNGRKYPEKVDFIGTTLDKSKQKLPDPLSKEEIEEIIQVCKNDRDRAMYKTLYEAGLRAGELMSLRIKDVKFNSKGVKLNVMGKTGNRQVLVVESERYLRNWLSKHPFDDRRNYPLWVKVDGNNIDGKTLEDMELSYDYMRINLKRKAVKAGVRVFTNENGNKTSEVHPHLFRHSRATHLATELTEAAMCEFFGWVQGSNMPQTYIHLSGRDIDGEIMKIYGLEEEEKKNEKRECPRCFKVYKGDESYCPRCGAPLDQEAARKAEDVREAADTIAQALISGEISKEEVMDLAKEMKEDGL